MHWYIRQTSRYTKAKALKDQMIEESIQDAVRRSQKRDEAGEEYTISAIDILVQQESKFASKESRAPE